MLFFTSLIFCLLLFVLPGELLLKLIAKFIPLLPEAATLAALNVGVYAAIYALLRRSRFIYKEERFDQNASHADLKEFLDVRGCHWLNLTGLIVLTAAATIVALNGLLPYPFWFLYAAIFVGLLDLFRRNRPVALPAGLPNLRFSPDITPLDSGEKRTFRWEMWTDEAGINNQEQTFNFDPAHYEAAVRDDHDDRTVLVRFVKSHLSQSVLQVAAFFREQSVANNFQPLQELENVVGFVRSIEYAEDIVTHGKPEYWNFSIETLWEREKGSDCEDHAFLAAALLHQLGHDVGLFYLALEDSGHLALAYHDPDPEIMGPFSLLAPDGKEYHYVETVPTSKDERLGSINEQFLRGLQRAKVVPVS